MVISWSMVEVPRYLFYAANLVMSRVPFPLFWLRYNLFAILYPSGISGEILQMFTSLPIYRETWPIVFLITRILMIVYLPAGPYMISVMAGQRRRANKKRREISTPKPEPTGLLFPRGPKGDRSTQEAGKALWAASLKSVDDAGAEKVLRARKWRFQYDRYVKAHVAASLQSPEAALRIAQQGINWSYDNFSFVRDGHEMPLREAMRTYTKPTFLTRVIKGQGVRQGEIHVPYKGRVLAGDALAEQARKWAADGVIEPSCADSIIAVATHPEWSDLSDKYFVLLGAGSAMGPLRALLASGANIIAVDLNLPRIWERLIKEARGSPGTLYFPISHEVEGDAALFAAAGCNLLTQTPEIRTWVAQCCPGKALTVGCYTYLDSGAHVLVNLACDAIMQGVCEARPDTSLAFLCSPTDVFVWPDEAREASKKQLRNIPLWQRLIKLFMFGRKMLPLVGLSQSVPCGKDQFYPISGLSIAQGPNYATAKRIQHWRAILARNAGFAVSSNIAPSTATASVLHNPAFALFYGGMHYFRPLEVMMQDTSNAIMTVLLINDVRDLHSAAHPNVALAHPLLLFSHNAFHGGIWRCAFSLNSIGEVAALAFVARKYAIHALLVAAGFVGGVKLLDWVV